MIAASPPTAWLRIATKAIAAIVHAAQRGRLSPRSIATVSIAVAAPSAKPMPERGAAACHGQAFASRSRAAAPRCRGARSRTSAAPSPSAWPPSAPRPQRVDRAAPSVRPANQPAASASDRQRQRDRRLDQIARAGQAHALRREPVGEVVHHPRASRKRARPASRSAIRSSGSSSPICSRTTGPSACQSVAVR